MLMYVFPIQAPPKPPPKPISRPAPLMGPFIGINSFVTEPLKRQVAAGWIREYHDWQWDEGTDDACYPHATVKFSPDYSGFDSDPFYKSRAAAGLRTHVVLQGRPLCQFGGAHPNKTIGQWKCVDSNADIGTDIFADIITDSSANIFTDGSANIGTGTKRGGDDARRAGRTGHRLRFSLRS